MSKSNIDHIIQIDRMRAIAIVIILFHHLPSYTFNFYNITALDLDFSFLNHLNRYFALGIFTFISGYLLEHKHPCLETTKDINKFLIKRYARIFPLYAISVIIFVILYHSLLYINYCSILINILGVQIILAKGNCTAIMTLWYVGLVLTYYYVFIIVKKFSHNMITFFICIVIIILVFIFFKFFIGIGDKRFLLYLPIFISGILVKKYNFTEHHNVIMYSLILILLVMICYCYIVFIYPLVYMRHIRPALFSFAAGELFIVSNLIMILSTYSLYGIVNSLIDNNFVNRVAHILSYSSYTTYLFHRPVWTIMEKFCHDCSDLQKLYFMIFVAIPITIFISYNIQYFYDRIILNRIFSKVKNI